MSRKKTEYLQCRINAEDKELIKKGAKVRGFDEVSLCALCELCGGFFIFLPQSSQSTQRMVNSYKF